MKSYTTRDVARLLGLSEPQVRSQARAGFLSPDRGSRNGYRFSFQDLVLLRTARELAQARVPSRRIRSALQDLARQLPTGRSLSELRITAEGHRVMVRDEGTAWNPESGQLQIDFSVRELTRRAAPVARRLVRSARQATAALTASEWFDLAVDLEAAAPAEACSAYARALALEPDLAEAHVNLGRLLQLAGRTAEAAEHYRRSLEAGGSDPTSAFNLGTALEELGHWVGAVDAYRRTLRDDPGFADAHFNLARLYEQMGRRSAAIRHLRAYQQLSKDV
ncbi:MAG TPA: tetratricopeptide repeat protein [Gemmatimonadales bacterium]|nr:tetratricopeptide repeat protein [Gemmatimonadales bacterium]